MSRVNKKDFALLLAAVLTSLLYFPLNESHGIVHTIATSWDRSLPFVPIFAVPYLLILPVFWLTFGYAFWYQKRFTAFACSLIGVWLVSYAFFIFFQTHVNRAVIEGKGFPENLVRFVYAHDQPYDAFPSLHVAMATLLSLYFYHIKSRWLPAVLAFSLLVAASTVLIKQHYLLDVVGGLLLSLSIARLAFRKL